MKKLAVLFVCVAMLASCDSFKGGSKDLKAENDSLLMELNQRNAELAEFSVMVPRCKSTRLSAALILRKPS